MDNLTLKKIQDVEFEILCAIDDFCKANDIKYSLYAGTALGAIRHKGFIPWDDDIDIAMTRNEFDKFCRTWVKKPVDGYYLESILTDEMCGTCHAKIRKNGTIYLSNGEVEKEGHHGIWIDIFPLDKVPFERRIRSKKRSIGKKMVLLTRANVKKTNDTIVKKVVRNAICIIPREGRMKRLRAMHAWLLCHMDDGTEHGFVWKSFSTMSSFNEVSYIPELCSSFVEVDFCGREFSIFKEYDKMLQEEFGDYMILPPESEQVSNHDPIKIQL